MEGFPSHKRLNNMLLHGNIHVLSTHLLTSDFYILTIANRASVNMKAQVSPPYTDFISYNFVI